MRLLIVSVPLFEGNRGGSWVLRVAEHGRATTWVTIFCFLKVPLGFSRLLGVYWLYPCIDLLFVRRRDLLFVSVPFDEKLLTTLEILTIFYRNSHTSVLKLWLKVKVHGCPNRFPRIMNEQLDWTWWECRVGCGPALLVPLGLSRLLGVYWLYPCIDRMWSAVGGFLEIGWGGAVPHMCSHFKRDTSLWHTLPSDIRSGVSAFRRFGSSGTQMCSLLQRCFASEYIA